MLPYGSQNLTFKSKFATQGTYVTEYGGIYCYGENGFKLFMQHLLRYILRINKTGITTI